MAAGSEILLQIKDQDLKIKEVPITCRYDIEDTSTHNPVVHGMKVLASIISEIEYKTPSFLYWIARSTVILCRIGDWRKWLSTHTIAMAMYHLDQQF
ncbi:hypothetical protein [uncultured Methanomethylovorans sp.]|uniref:hypothetical protein n=1 Tax=uncultured Methanomethylovorans sp. TaxID=183759 RepID=UPI002AA5F810|nr:hypothetical protein [uncultured Methanomethylovorans sp.]